MSKETIGEDNIQYLYEKFRNIVIERLKKTPLTYSDIIAACEIVKLEAFQSLVDSWIQEDEYNIHRNIVERIGKKSTGYVG